MLHVFGRGCAGRPVLGSADDKGHFAYLLNAVATDCDWQILGWVLMSNHHHLVLRLRERNLSDGMRHLHGLHAVAWNRRHQEQGHVWQGRFGSIVADQHGYAGRLMLYVDRNPVRAGLVRDPADWRWGGYRAAIGLELAQPFHDVAGGRRVLVERGDRTAEEMQEAYRRRVVRRPIRVDGVEDTRPPLELVVGDGSIDSVVRAVELWGYSWTRVAEHLGIPRSTLVKACRESSVTKGSDPFGTRAKRV